MKAQAIVPIDHSLADAEKVSIDDLKDKPIVRLMHGLLLREQLDDMFRSAGILPKQTCEVASSSLACALVADGGGITIADELVAKNVDGGRIRAIPITPERWMSFGLLFPISSEPNDACDRLVEILKSHVAKLAASSRSIEVVS